MQIIGVLKVIMPIFVPLILGIFIRHKQILSPACIGGIKTFVMKFGIPCMLFNAYVSCSFGQEILVSMALVFVLTLLLALLGFRLKKRAPWNYHNLPMMLAETEGSFGVPLIIVLFGMTHTFRIAALDMAQTFIGVPIITLLSTDTSGGLRFKQLLKKLLSVPVLLGMAAGLLFNLTGLGRLLEPSGILSVITAVTDAVSAPVSTLLLVCVGYDFHITADSKKEILRGVSCHVILRAVFCGLIQAGLLLMPNVSPYTRWAILLFSFLPPSFLAINLGKTQQDNSYAASVCSVCTFITLAVYCIIAVFS